MKNLKFYSLILAFIISWSASFSQSSQNYQVGGTTYYYGETYKTTGKPKVKRSSSAKTEFLKSRGYKKVPNGYEIDHIVPLSQGGADEPYNMQLITKEQHKAKTAKERKSNSYTSTSTYSKSTYKSTSTPKPTKYKSTSTYNSNRTIHTGSRGGKYYINSKGNKTYIKRK